MTRWGALALVIGQTGCAYLLGLDKYPPGAGPDAASDSASDSAPDDAPDSAPVLICPTMHAGVAFCADFDEATPVVYVQNTPTFLDLTASQVDVTRAAPAISAPHALWLTAHTGTYFPTFMPPTAMRSMSVSFQLQIASTSTSTVSPTTSLIRLTALGTGLPSCYADLILDEGAHVLRLQDACNVNNASSPIGMPVGWVPVAVRLDLTAHTASVSVNGQPAMTILTGTPGTPGPWFPTLELGIENTGHDGLHVGFDDVVLTTAP